MKTPLIHRSVLAAFWLLALLTCFSGRTFAQDYGLTTRPVVGAYMDNALPSAAPTVSAGWSVVLAFPNLTFLNPMGLLPLPGTNQLVVWEREGRVYAFNNDVAASSKTLLLDLSSQCQGWDDSGLMGMAFHPNFTTNRYVYLWYNWRAPGTILGGPSTRPQTFRAGGRNRLARFTLDANGVAVPGSEFIILDQSEDSLWHNGGGMFFHPNNGFLYLTNGDDSVATNNGVINSKLMGGVLRIDIDKRGGSISHAPPRRATGETSPNWPAHFIPNDNPFVGVANALEEFYALGLRSPHRMTLDPVTQRIFIGDVGGAQREEIDVIEPNDPPGLNFQWSQIEGSGGQMTGSYIGVSKPPIMDYTHYDGNAIIGGYVYRGQQFAGELGGKYIFGDNTRNIIWVLNESTNPPSKTLLATMPAGAGPNSGNNYIGLSSFGVDAAGELYMCQLSSTVAHIYKLQRGGGSSSRPLPATLSAVGAFSNLPALTASDKIIPYTINAPFHSDHAIKQRWAMIPGNTTIGFAPTGEWTFPAGSVMFKHFDLATDEVNPGPRKRLETRILVRAAAGGVYGATYKWRADNSEADLLDTALTENIPITIAPPGTFTGADIGIQTLNGSTARSGDVVTIQAGGSDIGGNSDSFHFAFQQRTGNFDFTIRIESLGAADFYTKAGLMARASLATNSAHVFALAFPYNATRGANTGGYGLHARVAGGGLTSDLTPIQPQPRVSYPNTWLRLQRTGDSFVAFSSNDGASWFEYSRVTVTLPETVFFGLAATARSSTTRTTAKIHLQNTRLQAWYYPSRQDCLTCHTPAAGGVLGIKTRQLNQDYTYPNGVTDNEIRAWNNIGLFSNAPAESAIPTFDKLAYHTDLTASLEKRARSYLDTNCASCHRPGGTQAFWDARYDTPLNSQGIIYGRVSNNLGIPNAYVVVPQNLDQSILYHRVNANGANKMPPLARNSVDHEGVAMLAEWINALPPNQLPQVTLTAPANNSSYQRGDNLTLAASASDADGILKVEFFAGTQKIGEDTSVPYSIVWTNLQVGNYSLTAVATDGIGASAGSQPVSISVQNAPGSANDFLGEYFNNQDLTSLVLTRQDPSINFGWGTASPDPLIGPDTFSVRWTGNITPSYSQAYTFYTITDDGVRLWVNNQLILNKWWDQNTTQATSSAVQLVAGQSYAVRMEYYDRGGAAVAQLAWSSASQPKSIINGPPLPAPANVFANAEFMVGNSANASGTSVNATSEPGEPIQFNGGKSVWVKWTAPNSGQATFSTAGSNFNTTLAVYTGSAVNALTLAAPANNDFTGTTSQVSVAVTAGTIYRVAVDGFNQASGFVVLSVSLPQ